MSEVSCHFRSAVDSHFAATIRPAEERALREHLPQCDRCHRYYERRLLLEKLSPKKLGAQARIGRALGLSGRSRGRAVWGPAFVAGSVALAAAALVVFSPAASKQLDGAEAFTARGDSVPSTSVERFAVYRIAPGAKPVPVGAEISAEDELGFAYAASSTDQKRWLMIFAVDEHRHVYWYHPSWTSAATNPSAISVRGDGVLRELPEAIRHPFDGGRLSVRALFLDRPYTVREIEDLIAAGASVDAMLAIPGSVEQRVSVQVHRSEQR